MPTHTKFKANLLVTKCKIVGEHLSGFHEEFKILVTPNVVFVIGLIISTC